MHYNETITFAEIAELLDRWIKDKRLRRLSERKR
jgi:hypothetical protein